MERTPMPTSQYSVEGRTAIVTGASSGIGKSIAERFAEDGANVAICSRAQERVDPVADRINDRGRPGRAIAIECDIRDREVVGTLVARTAEEFGGIDILVNNAAGSFVAPFEEISENGWKTIIDINLHGTFHCTQAAGEHLRESDGDVINISSINGQMAAPGESHYGTSKAGLINFTETLAAEWAEYGVRVNCVAPGLVLTPGVEQVQGVDVDEMPERTVVDRQIGHAEEIADIVQFLASPAASFMTGETITAQGVPPTTDLDGRHP